MTCSVCFCSALLTCLSVSWSKRVYWFRQATTDWTHRHSLSENRSFVLLSSQQVATALSTSSPLTTHQMSLNTVHSRGPGLGEAPQLRLVLLVVSWSKFKTAPALKGPDAVLCILPSGSIIFVLWTALLSTAPHPAASPGFGLSSATFGITLFSYFQLWLIGGFFFGGKGSLYFNIYLFCLNY